MVEQCIVCEVSYGQMPCIVSDRNDQTVYSVRRKRSTNVYSVRSLIKSLNFEANPKTVFGSAPFHTTLSIVVVGVVLFDFGAYNVFEICLDTVLF
jgi:hypothetical protein